MSFFTTPINPDLSYHTFDAAQTPMSVTTGLIYLTVYGVETGSSLTSFSKCYSCSDSQQCNNLIYNHLSVTNSFSVTHAFPPDAFRAGTQRE